MNGQTPRIAIMPGDGIGPEVLEAAMLVLDAVGFHAEYIPCDIGWRYWCAEGDALPTRTIESLTACRAALFGAITSKPMLNAEADLAPRLRGRGLKYASPIVRLRQEFDLFAAVRPCRALAGNPRNVHDAVDVVVFRENTEGLYAGIEWHPVPESLTAAIAASHSGASVHTERWRRIGLGQVAISTRVTTVPACERIIRAAFEYAAQHRRRRVTLLEKPNVLRESGGLMTRVFRAIAREYPAVPADEVNVDAACMRLVTDPGRFDVMVAENMFGDIISDLTAGLVGGLGFTPSANIGSKFAVFEPVHGSAPDIAGLGVANPIAMILSAGMMLDWLGDAARAARITAAVESVVREGLVRTPDVAGPEGTGTTLGTARIIADRARG